MAAKGREPRLVVVSNRLPIILTYEEDEGWHVDPGSGGLVAALVPVLRERGGVWIGWPGVTGDEVDDLEALVEEATHNFGFSVEPVDLALEDLEGFYYGFSNEVIWPLFHDFPSHCNFNPEYWRAYQRANREFAGVISDKTEPGDFVWVHDYHLMAVARELREVGFDLRVGFFLHTPFPPPDIFFKLPWRTQILHGLLEYDLIGLQTARDVRNFLQCVRPLIGEITVRGRDGLRSIEYMGREVRVGAFPISIDYNEYSQKAATPEVNERAAYLQDDLLNRQMILGVDRLDYSKGIPHRLDAFRNALDRFPDLHDRVTLVQVVVPSREDIPKYHDLKVEIEQLVGEINGQFTVPGWVPIHYMYRRLDFTELVSYYRAAGMALITPLKDGMNLIAKEYCAACINEEGALILSEFAGAAAELKEGAILVNPYDVEGVADAVYSIFKMTKEERRRRMSGLRKIIAQSDIFTWVDSFLDAVTIEEFGGMALEEAEDE